MNTVVKADSPWLTDMFNGLQHILKDPSLVCSNFFLILVSQESSYFANNLKQISQLKSVPFVIIIILVFY